VTIRDRPKRPRPSVFRLQGVAGSAYLRQSGMLPSPYSSLFGISGAKSVNRRIVFNIRCYSGSVNGTSFSPAKKHPAAPVVDSMEPAREIVPRILLVFLEEILDLIPAIITEGNPGNVHDVRVAARRTRAIFGRLKHLFVPDVGREFLAPFRRLGSITGRCRDLDVWLEFLDTDREQILIHHIGSLRDMALEKLRTELPSCLQDLVEQKDLLVDFQGDIFRGEAGGPIGPIARSAVLKARRRLKRRVQELPDNPTRRMLHRIRIDGKRYRYLVEVFETPKDSIIEKLKGLQDALGRINDRLIQLKALDVITPTFDTELALSAGRHHRRLEADLENARKECEFQIGILLEFLRKKPVR